MERNNQKFLSLFSLALKTTFLLLFLFYLIIFSPNVPGWLNPVFLSIFVLVWLAFGRAQTGLELPVLLFAGVIFFTSFFAVDPRRSFEQAWLISTGLCILLIVPLLVQWGLSAARIAMLALLVGGAVMYWSWRDAAAWYTQWLLAAPGEWIPSISFRLHGSNNMAAYFNVLLMVSLGFQFIRLAYWQRILLGLYSLSAVLLIFLASSRGAWVGAAAGFFVLVVFIVSYTGVDLRATWRKQRRKAGFWLAAAGLVSLIAVVASLYMGRLLSHPTHGALLTSRTPFWPVGWGMFLRSPLVGSGWNVYASFYMRVNSAPPGEIFLHSHNQLLDVLACSGLLGAGALLFLLWRLARAGLERWNVSGRMDKAVLAGVLAACATYLVHGLFDGLYRMPFASLSLVVVVGAALAQLRPVPWRMRAGLAALGTALVAFGFVNAWRLEPLYQGVQAGNAGNTAQAAADFQEATRRDPNLAIGYQQLGLALSLQADQGNPEALDGAIAAFERAASLDPDWGLNHANLGALYRTHGDLDAAAVSFRKATAAAPKAALYWLHLGAVEELRGNLTAARDAYAEALLLQPELYPSSYWRSTETRGEAVGAFLQETPVEAVDLTAAQRRVDAGEGVAIDFIRLGERDLQAGNLAAAGRNLKIAALAYFHGGAEQVDLDWAQAELAAAEGRTEDAARLGQQAMEAMRNPGVYGPGQGAYYAPLVFHVPHMGREMVEGMGLGDLAEPWIGRKMVLEGW